MSKWHRDDDPEEQSLADTEADTNDQSRSSDADRPAPL